MKSLLFIILMSFTLPTFSQTLNYLVKRENGVVSVTSSIFGSWYANPLLAHPIIIGTFSTQKPYKLEFEFSSNDYFIESNSGHFAVGMQGSYWQATGRAAITGRGVVIGNVSAYPNSGKCSPQPYGHRVSLEGFYGTTNCVYGNSTASIPLINGEKYKITITAHDRVVSYNLFQKVQNRWVSVSSAAVYDDGGSADYGSGWWITEVFSTHSWTFNIANLKQQQ